MYHIFKKSWAGYITFSSNHIFSIKRLLVILVAAHNRCPSNYLYNHASVLFMGVICTEAATKSSHLNPQNLLKGELLYGQ